MDDPMAGRLALLMECQLMETTKDCQLVPLAPVGLWHHCLDYHFHSHKVQS